MFLIRIDQAHPVAAPKLMEAEEFVSLEEADAEEDAGKVKAVVPESEDRPPQRVQLKLAQRWLARSIERVEPREIIAGSP